MAEQGTDATLGTAGRLVVGLRVGILVITTAVLATASLFRNLAAYHPLWPQLAAFGTDAAIMAAELVLSARGRSWGRFRWIGLGFGYAAAVVSAVGLGAGRNTTALDWAYGTTGWVGVVLLLDQRFTHLVWFLALHEATTVAVVLLGAPTGMSVLNALVAAVGGIGFPLGTGFGATVLRSIAARAHRAADQVEQVRSAEEVSAALHGKRRERLAELDQSAVPLLRGLADGVLDPEDPGVQRACAIEAARLRRLFAEVEDVANPLMHELAHCADVAERRGVIVDLEFAGAWSLPDRSLRRALTQAPLEVLATARTSARVTALGTPGLLTISVVADCGEIELTDPDHEGIEVEKFRQDDLTWVEVRWRTA
ncbi:hypothetical protein [Actinokineospora enzanensis]|uniref:hypothetical protein n=1 Tax=Actinokineospora enzanensis TaxID=155975 RepID=UPI000378E677|nr:hypothetical protein [Actinokineospora enzanensis]